MDTPTFREIFEIKKIGSNKDKKAVTKVRFELTHPEIFEVLIAPFVNGEA